MYTTINHNLMAANAARNLNQHYGNLATSTQRLSSGLRINSAADDAAGLAIRELQRADVAALNQGVRNANDAISMIQVVDGALGVIDEKLIRMKELAEQAATGTYDSTQRLMIDSEFQAMASEIQRIATATDFNGIKLIGMNDPVIPPEGIKLNTVISNTISDTENFSERKYNYDPNNIKGGGTIEISDTIINRTGNEYIEYFVDNGILFKKTTNDIIIDKITETQPYAISNYGGGAGGLFNSWANTTRIQNSEFLDFMYENYPTSTFNYYNGDNSIIIKIEYEYVDEPELAGANFLGHNHKYSVYLNVTGDDQVDIIEDLYFRRYYDSEYIKQNFRHVSNSITGHERLKTLSHEVTHDDSVFIEEVPTENNANKVKIHFGPMNDLGFVCTIKISILRPVR